MSTASCGSIWEKTKVTALSRRPALARSSGGCSAVLAPSRCPSSPRRACADAMGCGGTGWPGAVGIPMLPPRHTGAAQGREALTWLQPQCPAVLPAAGTVPAMPHGACGTGDRHPLALSLPPLELQGGGQWGRCRGQPQSWGLVVQGFPKAPVPQLRAPHPADPWSPAPLSARPGAVWFRCWSLWVGAGGHAAGAGGPIRIGHVSPR